MNKGLKNKGLGSWLCLAAALVALITGIVFLSTQATAAPLGHSGTMPGVVLLVGAAASLVFFFVAGLDVGDQGFERGKIVRVGNWDFGCVMLLFHNFYLFYN